ncbi:hypothetical protein [Lacticaseibacillus pantheris]|uniref:hypothetical protein n=1 Tax=Lacticaseibacillus pantheris TaxID=171523 RepID=UPI00265A3858|nr:hypothetical protein [Lacticaseibacillus pantheris]WKF86007.1 hypothetical protein QY874_05350 [Lacticaseibacillus pantheris]
MNSSENMIPAHNVSNLSKRRVPHKLVFAADADYAQAAKVALWRFLNVSRGIPATVQVDQAFDGDPTADIVVRTLISNAGAIQLHSTIMEQFSFMSEPESF